MGTSPPRRPRGESQPGLWREEAPAKAAPRVSRRFDAFIDGASRNNPGHSALGVVLREPGGGVVAEESAYLGIGTNNEAEYRALLRALERARELGATGLRVHSDSELVVRQLEGRYRVKEPRLKELYNRARVLLAGFEEAEVVHVPRERNREADRLANRALDDHIREVTAEGSRMPKQAG